MKNYGSRSLSESTALLNHPFFASVAVLGIRLLSSVSAFLFTVLITRSIGASGAGIFFTGLSLATVASILFRFGTDGAALKYIAREHGLDNFELARSYFLFGLTVSIIGGLLGTLLLYLGVWTGIRYYGLDADYGTYLAAFSFSLLPLSIMALMSESLKATDRVSMSVIVSGLINFVVAGILLSPMRSIFGNVGVSIAYLSGLVAAITMAAVHLRHYLRMGPILPVRTLDYVRSLRHFWLISIFNRAIGPYAPLLLLSLLSTVEQVGLFGTAFRVAMVLSLFLAAANAVLSPRISQLYYRGELTKLCILTRRFAFFQNIFVVPLLVTMVVSREQLMGLFGPEFVSGATAFTILAIGQVFNSLTGSVGNILVMTGHEREMWFSSVFGTVLMLLASILLVPSFAATGAAFATAFGVIATNTSALLFVRLRLGFFVVPWFLACNGPMQNLRKD